MAKRKNEFKTKIVVENPSSDVGKLQIEEISGDYVTDAIGDAWKYWRSERAVVLDCPTGSGKTHFFLSTLIQSAIRNENKTVVVSNRVLLGLAFKKAVLQSAGIENKWTDNELMEKWDFGGVFIFTYPKLYSVIDKFDVENVEYLIMDEVHYFMDDSTFSGITGQLLNEIPLKFKNSKRIYVSATASEVTPYIVKAETKKLHCMPYEVRHMSGSLVFPVADRFSRYQLDQVIKEQLYAHCAPTPIVYKMEEDFSYLNIKYFEDFKVIEELIQKSGNEKWIIFVMSKEFGIALHEKYPDSLYIDADTKGTDNEKIMKLVENESFDAKMLICTSVFINGNNIKDKKVKNVVIFHNTVSDIKQAIGRVRVSDKKYEKVNIYLKIPNISELSQMIGRNKVVINEYETSLKYRDYLPNIALHSSEWKELKQISFTDKGRLKINWLSIEKFINNNIFYDELIKHLKKGGVIHYCKFITNFFKLPFKNEMCELLIDKRAEIIKYLEKLVEGPVLEKDVYIEASEKITELRKKYGFYVRSGSSRENFGLNRKPLDVKAMNNRLEQFKFSYYVEKLPNERYKFHRK